MFVQIQVNKNKQQIISYPTKMVERAFLFVYKAQKYQPISGNYFSYYPDHQPEFKVLYANP